MLCVQRLRQAQLFLNTHTKDIGDVGAFILKPTLVVQVQQRRCAGGGGRATGAFDCGAQCTAEIFCLLVQQLLKASHPPAAATALLIALGGFKLVPSDMLAIAVGVGLIVLIGEPLRRARAGILFGDKRNK